MGKIVKNFFANWYDANLASVVLSCKDLHYLCYLLTT